MSETVKKDFKRDKKENCDDIKKPERSIQAKHVDFAKGFVVTDNIRKVLAEECAEGKIPEDTFELNSRKNPMEKSPIHFESSPMPIPATTSAIVGWRSSRREYDLEFVGPLYVSAKYTIEPPLMPDEFRVTRQKFIFLG